VIRSLEEISLNAWPAIESLRYDGWLLRFSGGYTRRANSVQCFDPGAKLLDEKIQFCENAYRQRRLRVVFKMTDMSQPAGLDEALSQRGYQKEAATSVQTNGIAGFSEKPSKRVHAWPRAEPQWLDAYAQLNGVAQEHRPTFAAIVMAIAQPMCCAMAMEGDAPVACGLAVVEGPWVGLFDIVTRQDRRRQGLAGEVIGHLLTWARQAGADKAYLQVMLNNPPALSLYKKLGFAEAYQYWYRVRP